MSQPVAIIVATALAVSASLLAGCPRPAPENAGGGGATTSGASSSTSSGGSGGSSGSTTGSAGSAGTGGCMGMLAACGGSCVDTTSDEAHCGACDHDCQGGDCLGGACQPVILAATQGGIYGGLAIDATNVYWTVTDTATTMGSVSTVPIAGGQPQKLAGNAGTFGKLAVDDANLYWTVPDLGLVLKVVKAGGTPDTVEDMLSMPTDIAVDQGGIYWTDYGDGSILEHDITGFLGKGIASGEMNPSGIALDNLNVYWTTTTEVRTRRKLGGAITSLATQQAAPSVVVVDTANIYWVNGGDNSVWTQPLAGTIPIPVSKAQLGVQSIAVDGQYIYWTAPIGQGTVSRAPIAGGTNSVTIATGQAFPMFVAVDAKNVFWINANTGDIMKLAK